MKPNLQNIVPLQNENPVDFANRVGEFYASTVSSTLKKENGQFFTPLKIARFMGNQIVVDKEFISILDPGCGLCILSCALIEHQVVCSRELKEIKLAVYETDSELIPLIELVLQYLKEWLDLRNIVLSLDIYAKDFILENSLCLEQCFNLYEAPIAKFDCIVSNPPYFKLSKDDIHVKAAQCIIDGQANIYSIFMAISTHLLKPNGQMIFIVPRSFTSGRYFRQFRTHLFKNVQIDFIHLFNSRKDVFIKDNVLQETLILKCSNTVDKRADAPVSISFSEGLDGLNNPSIKKFKLGDIVDLKTVDKIIHIPVNIREESIIKLFKFWDGSLKKYNIQISTGPVVAFRSKDYLLDDLADGCVPLYWLHNVVKMLSDHPIIKNAKCQYIKVTNESRSMLLPNKNYVFLRRFSSKDDSSRLIAAPYFGNASIYPFVGVENKLNYIYRPKGHLGRTETIGIAALLNSELFNIYFRTFNGNVNVSATELREMPLPELEKIKAIGKKIILMNNFSLENINFVVDSFFNIQINTDEQNN